MPFKPIPEKAVESVPPEFAEAAGAAVSESR